MYSPFFDIKGKPLQIEKVKYSHLTQLKDCDEGHHLEFKLLLEDGGKAQLAKEITSFANCEGGWLIVGVDDKTKELKPIDKQDYSQRVGKIATRISPMPEFNTRFLTLPNDKKKGVLIIYVHEGKNAPYICNGSIYVRSGSSKEPVKAADRGNVEYLYERTRSYKKDVENFCRRDYFFAYNNTIQRKVTYPIASVYLKNISEKKNKFFNLYANRDEFIEFVKGKTELFECVSYSMESIIFKHRNVYPRTNSGTFVFEMFYDWSCKIHIPLGVENDFEKEEFIDLFKSLGVKTSIAEEYSIINGSLLLNSVFCLVKLFHDIAKEYKLKEKDYAFCVEVENAGGVVPAFYGEEYKEYVLAYGVPYAHKERNRSQIYYFRDFTKVTFETLVDTLIADDFCATLGIRSDSIFKIMQDANKRYIKS